MHMPIAEAAENEHLIVRESRVRICSAPSRKMQYFSSAIQSPLAVDVNLRTDNWAHYFDIDRL